jgi:hypothetical protein
VAVVEEQMLVVVAGMKAVEAGMKAEVGKQVVVAGMKAEVVGSCLQILDFVGILH